MEFANALTTPGAPGAATGISNPSPDGRKSFLQEGWVIANHILVSFHVAFISSVLMIPEAAASRDAVLHFIFASPEALVSAIFTYAVFHSAIALHELGHFLEAARLRALNDSIQDAVLAQMVYSECPLTVGQYRPNVIKEF